MAWLFWLNILLLVANGANKPNILLMIIDDLGYTDISAHGAEYQTKNIDSLISSGIELTNYHVHYICTPTRSALMTGQYSFKNGLQTGVKPATTKHIPAQNPTFPELLSKLNYTNHMEGKWHLGYAAWNMTPTARGFDSHFGYYQGAEDYYTHEVGNGHGYDFFNNKQPYFGANETYSINLYYAQFENILRNYINNRTEKEQPLFLYMAFQTVHSPIENPPQLYLECNDIANLDRKSYCQKMVALDNTINDMINLYKKYNLWDDTLLIVTTDNGGMPYWSDDVTPSLYVSWGCNMPYRAGKATLFQGGVKGVGFVNGGQNIIPSNVRGTKSNILSHVIDWLPTVIEGVLHERLPPNIPFDGKNMWTALMQKDESFNRTTLYIDIQQNGSFAGIIDSNWKYFQGQQLYTGYFPCNQSGVYDNSSETVLEWLFDLQSDPYETTNLASSNSGLVKKYQTMIRDFIENGGYMPEQSDTKHPEAQPQLHGGVWLPWLT